MYLRSFVAALVLSVPTFLCAANPLERVPADTDIVVSVNLRQVLDSSYAQKLLAAPEAQQLNAGIEIVRNLAGVDVRKDLDRLVVFGKADDQKNGGVRIEGRLQPDKLITLVKANPKYSTFQIGGATIHQWYDEKEGRDKFGTFEGTGALTIANTRPEMEACIAAASDKSKSMASRQINAPIYLGSGASAQLLTPEQCEGHAAWVMIVRPDSNGKLSEGARKLFMTSATAVADLGASGLTQTVTFNMESEEKAATWSDVTRGAVSLLKHQEENKDLEKIAEEAKVAVVNGKSVTVTAAVNAELLDRIVEKAKGDMAKK